MHCGARGFALYFARCNAPFYRNRLATALQEQLSRPVVHIDLDTVGSETLDAHVEAALVNVSPDAVAFIYGLESRLPSLSPDIQARTLSELNWRRGAFSRLQRPMVFWVPEYALNILAQGAPDFYDWYCGVYRFDLPTATRTELRQQAFEELDDYTAVAGMTLEEKQRWNALLEELIADTDETTTIGQQNLIRLLDRQGKLALVLADFRLARTAYERAIQIAQAAYGPDDPEVAPYLNNLGRVLQDLGALSEARATFERALKIAEAAYGHNHPNVAVCINNLGSVFRDCGDLWQARAAFERALKIDEAAYGPEHPEVATDVNNLGGVLREMKDLLGARAAFERTLKIAEVAYGPDHPEVATYVNNLGLVLQDLGNLPGARTSFERALKIDQAAYGSEHPEVARDSNNLGHVLQDMGDLVGARAAYERASQILMRFLGPEHPDVKIVQGNLKALNLLMEA